MNSFNSEIKKILAASITTKQQILEDANLIAHIEKITLVCIEAFQKGHKVFFCGNGGSAADAQHLATEFSARFYLDRSPLYAEALHVNSSHMTAIANDYSFEEVYSKAIEAKGSKGDVLFGISTSGNSINIIKALQMAQSKGVITVGMTGQTGGKMPPVCDYWLPMPSTDTPRIQEAHITVGHIICQLVEASLFGAGQ